MMYSEFQALFEKAKPDAPVPTPEAYNESIEPFYMAANMDKTDFVKQIYARFPNLVANISGELLSLRRILLKANDEIQAANEERRKAEAQFKATIEAMENRQKELEEKVAMLTRENEAALNENGCLQFEAENLRKRYARLVRGLCDECFSKVLFDEND